MEPQSIFLLIIGIIGFIITIYTWFTGEKKGEKQVEFIEEKIKIFNFKIEILTLIYLFIIITLIFIGIISKFYFPTIIN